MQWFTLAELTGIQDDLIKRPSAALCLANFKSLKVSNLATRTICNFAQHCPTLTNSDQLCTIMQNYVQSCATLNNSEQLWTTLNNFRTENAQICNTLYSCLSLCPCLWLVCWTQDARYRTKHLKLGSRLCLINGFRSLLRWRKENL